jgi:hypothetical protein
MALYALRAIAEVPIAQEAPDGSGGGGGELDAEAADVRGGRRAEEGRGGGRRPMGGADHRVPASGNDAARPRRRGDGAPSQASASVLPAAARLGPPHRRRCAAAAAIHAARLAAPPGNAAGVGPPAAGGPSVLAPAVQRAYATLPPDLLLPRSRDPLNLALHCLALCMCNNLSVYRSPRRLRENGAHRR